MSLLNSRSLTGGRIGQRSGGAKATPARIGSRAACRPCTAFEQQHEGPSRRELLSSIALVSSGLMLPGGGALPMQALAEGQVATKELYDPILAYRFAYPVATTSGKPLSMLTSRRPEKYSSAAPLSADARQRIVSELVDLKNFVTVSVTLGPASGVLKGRALEEWKPREVAMTVLIDRSTARLSSGQRTALNDIESVAREDRADGQPYWVYEHLSQGSPNLARPDARETYRHALAVTAQRPGLDGNPYLYTLNLVCSEEMWPELESPFRDAVNSFQLVAPTKEYIPPDQNPWLFF